MEHRSMVSWMIGVGAALVAGMATTGTTAETAGTTAETAGTAAETAAARWAHTQALDLAIRENEALLACLEKEGLAQLLVTKEPDGTLSLARDENDTVRPLAGDLAQCAAAAFPSEQWPAKPDGVDLGTLWAWGIADGTLSAQVAPGPMMTGRSSGQAPSSVEFNLEGEGVDPLYATHALHALTDHAAAVFACALQGAGSGNPTAADSASLLLSSNAQGGQLRLGGEAAQGSDALRACLDPILAQVRLAPQDAPTPDGADLTLRFRPGVTAPKLGGLPKNVIDETVKADLAGIKQCYQTVLNRLPRLAGKVVVRFHIAPEGSVSSAEIAVDELHNSEVTDCVADRFLKLAFPPVKDGGIVIVTYPFNFASDSK